MADTKAGGRRPDAGWWITSVRPAAANIAGGSLSPSDEVLQLGGEGYSPGLLKKIEYAGGNHRSFTMAADGLEVLAEQAVTSIGRAPEPAATAAAWAAPPRRRRSIGRAPRSLRA